MPNLIDFEWERHLSGYEIERGEWIKPIDAWAGVTRYRPLDENPALFAIFASLEDTPESYVRFATTYGPIEQIPQISRNDWRYDEGFMWGTPLEAYRQARQEMWLVFECAQEGMETGDFRKFLHAMHQAEWVEPELKLAIEFLPGKKRPELVLVPDGLVSAMKLQLMQAVCEDTFLRRCVNCGTWFAYGQGGARRRKSAHYCSNACKQAMYRRRKEERDGIDSKA